MIELVVVILFIVIMSIALAHGRLTKNIRENVVVKTSRVISRPAPAAPAVSKKRQRVSFAPVANKRFVDIDAPVGGNATFIQDVRVKV